MRKIKKAIKGLVIGFALGVAAFGMTSCASADQKATSYSFSVVSCTYDGEQDATKIVWTSRLVNESIYDIKTVSFKFDLYDGEALLRTTDYVKYTIPIKHGGTNAGNRSFSAEGNVNGAKINTWTASFANVWESYLPWFISTIAAAPTLALIYIIIMIVQDIELEDLGDFIEEHFWGLGVFAIPFIPYLIESSVTASWSFVPPLIIAGGVVALVVLVLVAHLIKFLFQEYGGCGENSERGLVKKHYDSKHAPYLLLEGSKKRYFIKDLLNDYEGLKCFSRNDLLAYCRENTDTEINGWKSKEWLINLAMDASAAEDEDDPAGESAEETVKKGKPKKSKPKSKTRFDDIAGLEQAKQAFKEKVVLPFEHPDLFERFGKKAGGGILLYGLPGTGKTMFAEAAANEADALFIPIKCSDIKSKWYGESEKKVKEIFQKARKAKKAILFFDEFEAIGAKRTDDDNNGNNDLVPQILAEMQGVGTSSSDSTIVVIAATNKPWSIDSAFMRPGRFDEKIYIPLPDYEARRRLFELQLSKLPISKNMDFDYLAKITEGFNGADIKEVCEKLKMSAIRDSLESNEEQEIGMEDVHRIEKSIQSSVSAEDIARLEAFEEETRK